MFESLSKYTNVSRQFQMLFTRSVGRYFSVATLIFNWSSQWCKYQFILRSIIQRVYQKYYIKDYEIWDHFIFKISQYVLVGSECFSCKLLNKLCYWLILAELISPLFWNSHCFVVILRKCNFHTTMLRKEENVFFCNSSWGIIFGKL